MLEKYSDVIVTIVVSMLLVGMFVGIFVAADADMRAMREEREAMAAEREAIESAKQEVLATTNDVVEWLYLHDDEVKLEDIPERFHDQMSTLLEESPHCQQYGILSVVVDINIDTLDIKYLAITENSEGVLYAMPYNGYYTMYYSESGDMRGEIETYTSKYDMVSTFAESSAYLALLGGDTLDQLKNSLLSSMY